MNPFFKNSELLILERGKRDHLIRAKSLFLKKDSLILSPINNDQIMKRYASEKKKKTEKNKRSSLLLEPNIVSIFEERMPNMENSSSNSSSQEITPKSIEKISKNDFLSIQEL